MVMVGTRVRCAHLMVDIEESGAVIADLTTCCGPRLTATIMTLKYAIVHPLLPSSSNRLDPYDERFSKLPNLPLSIQ
ncbi:hypothetical protein TNCV_2686221 [Trichonephila clavipes]|nr:hypothetical protein TNCV_2686221 [Trichonephila clavipes]